MTTLQATANAEALMLRAEELIGQGRTGAARPLLAALRRLGGKALAVSRLAARVALREEAFTEAQLELDAGIAVAPEDPDLRKLRAELRRNLGDIGGAAADAAEAVILDRHDPAAKALLGVLLLELGQPEEAAICLREAVAASPDHPAYIEGFAAAQVAQGDAEAALQTLLGGIAAVPEHVGLRNAALLQCLRQRDFNQGVALAEQAQIAGIVDACLFGLKGHALSSLGRHEDAAEAYQEALKLGPDDTYVRHLAASAGSVPGGTRAPSDYVRTLFDGYADGFEEHLISLGYRVPALIRTALLRHPKLARGEHAGPVLDLGCGTGLIAVVLSDLRLGPFTGIDVSARMLASARAKELYAELRESELLGELARDTTRWPVIVAGDVLCYFGALEQVFAAVHARLTPGGWFAFSVEELAAHQDGPGWALHRQGRYVHAEAYLRRTVHDAGFAVCDLKKTTLRFEAGAPVAGIIVTAERIRDDG